MVTLEDICNKISSVWQGIRSGFVALKMGLQRLPGKIIAPFVAAWAAAKGMYNKIIDFINTHIEEIKSQIDELSEGVQSGAGDISAMQYFEVANTIFPISELIQVILILLGLWAVCLIVRVAFRIFKIIMEIIPG